MAREKLLKLLIESGEKSRGKAPAVEGNDFVAGILLTAPDILRLNRGGLRISVTR
jgi:hypothetical protein